MRLRGWRVGLLRADRRLRGSPHFRRARAPTRDGDVTYRPPATGEHFGFGDLLTAEWFHAAYLRRDAVTLEPGPVGRGNRATWQQATPIPGQDGLLAHGSPFPVVLLSDPCETESVTS